MDSKIQKLLPLLLAVLGLFIMGIGLGKQVKGGSGLLVWIGLAVTFVGIFLSSAINRKLKK